MIYLAGPITGESYEGATDWRDHAKEQLLPLKGVSPMRGKMFLMNKNTLQDAYDTNENPMLTTKAIARRDRFDCVRSDLILMNLLGAQRVSIGTMIEIGWAYTNRTPIVLVMEKEGNVHEHCLLRESVDFRFDNLDEAIDAIKYILE